VFKPLMWPAPRLARTYGLSPRRGCAPMMSSAIFGSINSIALPFYVFRPGLSKPVPREVLAKEVGRDCNLDRIIDAIRGELRGRPYDLVAVAGGWQHRTRKRFADATPATTWPQAKAAVSGRSRDYLISKHVGNVPPQVLYWPWASCPRVNATAGRRTTRDGCH